MFSSECRSASATAPRCMREPILDYFLDYYEAREGPRCPETRGVVIRNSLVDTDNVESGGLPDPTRKPLCPLGTVGSNPTPSAGPRAE